MIYTLILQKMNIIPSIEKKYGSDNIIDGRIIKSNGPGWDISYKKMILK